MKGIRMFAGPLLLGLLVAGALPPQAVPLRGPEGPDAGLALRAPPVEDVAFQPADEAPRDVAPERPEACSGGPAGAFLVVVALAAAVALLLAAVVPW